CIHGGMSFGGCGEDWTLPEHCNRTCRGASGCEAIEGTIGMINAFGQPGHVLLLGGTSDIAVATAVRWARSGSLKVTLAARPGARRDRAMARLSDLGVDVGVIDF